MRVAMLLLLLGCAGATLPDGEPPRGFTMCANDEHYGFVRTDALAQPDADGVIAHERTHLTQMRLIGGCEEWKTYLSVKENRARAEAHAFCVQAAVGTQQKLFPTLGHAVDYYSRSLATYDIGVSQDSARSLIGSFCRA